MADTTDALSELLDYHEKQADHFAPFGLGNALTLFHNQAAATIHAAIAALSPTREAASPDPLVYPNARSGAESNNG